MNISEEGVESINGVKVYRIWEPVLEKKIKLDDTSNEAIRDLMEAAEKIWDMDKEKVYSFLDDVTSSPIPDKLKLKDENRVKENSLTLEEPQKETLYLPS